MTPEERKHLLENLVYRLEAPKEEVGGRHRSDEVNAESPIMDVPAIPKNMPTHVALTSALLQMAREEPSGSFDVPLGLVTQSEWQALLDTFVSLFAGLRN